MVEGEVELIRDYRQFPLRPGEDMKIVELYRAGKISREKMADALHAADEAAFERDWRRRNSDHRKRKKVPDESEAAESESDVEGSDADEAEVDDESP